MYQPHLIDSAIFDTTYADTNLADEQRAQIDAFIKNDLMNVVDEVFDQVEGNFSKRDGVLRLDNLEIDLGSIDYLDYRRQMPRSLREKLLQALGDRAYSGPDPVPGSAVVDGKSATQDQLFYFLRHGYLPWYSRVDAADTLDALLIESLDVCPDNLIGFLRDHAQHAGVLQRLVQQFSPRSQQRLMDLLSSTRGSPARQALTELENMLLAEDAGEPSGRTQSIEQAEVGAAPVDPATRVDRLHAQWVNALLSGDADLLETRWQALYHGHAELLAKTLRYYGQRASVRRRIVATSSSALLAGLLRVLEPEAHEFVQLLIEHTEIFEVPADDSAAYRVLQPSELWEYSLGYLLVERGARFDKQAYLVSLLRQIAIASRQRPSDLLARLVEKSGGLDESKIPAELSRQFRALQQLTELAALAEVDSDGAPSGLAVPAAGKLAVDAELQESYRRYRRVKAALTISETRHRGVEAQLVADIDTLARETPWLLQRLYRELQTGSYAWSRAISNLPVPVLAEFCYALLSLNQQADSNLPYGAATDLVTAIQTKAAVTDNRHALFAYILGRLIEAELIDLSTAEYQPPDEERVSAAPTGVDTDAGAADIDAEPTPELGLMHVLAGRQMLQSAELLTTAAGATNISQSAEQLDRLKWRFIESYAKDTGYLYNETYFLSRYVDFLIQGTRPADSSEFRALLGQALLQNSLPSTRDLTRRLIEAIDHSAEFSEPPEVHAPQPLLETDDEPLALEQVYIANAGMVLLAPYLPRLFERLGFIDAGQFKSRDAAERAVHCLQFLVNSNLSSPEYQLVLNKLICGIKLGLPIRRGIELGVDEIEQLEGLLQAVTQHWKALENTSIDGLRESFLQRNGRLQLKSDSWHLAVEAGPFDMLLDQVPWSFSTIKFAWMKRVIYVEWR